MRVLILAPWPLIAPRHGGQLRGAAVVKAYRDAGHDVHPVSVFDPTHTPAGEVGQNDIVPTSSVAEALQSSAKRQSDVAVWSAFAAAPDAFDKFVSVVRRLKPDVLQFEEPVFWPIVSRLRSEGHLTGVVLIHSSYNFETTAWRLRDMPGSPVSAQTVRDITSFEQGIAKGCDLIVTVSNDDAADFRRIGAANVIVSENGVSTLAAETRSPIASYIGRNTPYALFVSSAHPPNAIGFLEMATNTVGHQLADGELLICGKVCSLIRGAKRSLMAGEILDKSRFLGWVAHDLLSSLYAEARVVILPKTNGGGSNLKTAEALASGRPIVATRNAFIGFEKFIDLPDVSVTDDPDEFWNLTNQHLGGLVTINGRPPATMSDLIWSECLKPMVAAAEATVRRRRHFEAPAADCLSVAASIE